MPSKKQDTTITTEELAYGAKLCWRNSSRCVGRQFWQGLNVRDYRHLTTPESMTQALFEHIEEATNNGNIQATMTVFAPDSPNKTGPRVWNSQLLRYAGYDDHGLVLGDPANVELTDIAIANGWQPLKAVRFRPASPDDKNSRQSALRPRDTGSSGARSPDHTSRLSLVRVTRTQMVWLTGSIRDDDESRWHPLRRHSV